MKRSAPNDVEIQITPMLDMAFQLLAFFILTYHPGPSEGQFFMNLAPAQPVAQPDAKVQTESAAATELPAALRTVTTTLRADTGGRLASVSLGEVTLEDQDYDRLKADLRERLEAIIKNPELPYDQALIEVDPRLRIEDLIMVIDVYSQLGVTKVSFAELGAVPGSPSL